MQCIIFEVNKQNSISFYACLSWREYNDDIWLAGGNKSIQIQIQNNYLLKQALNVV